MPARDGADRGELARAPPQHEHAGVVPEVHVDRVLACTKARHRGGALARADVATAGHAGMPNSRISASDAVQSGTTVWSYVVPAGNVNSSRRTRIGLPFGSFGFL